MIKHMVRNFGLVKTNWNSFSSAWSIIEMGIEANPNSTRTLNFQRIEQNYRTQMQEKWKEPEQNPNNEDSFPSLVLSALSAL